MKKHVKIYYSHFDLGMEDLLLDEFEFVENGREIRATQIHHIMFGSSKYDHIDNLMALSFDNHSKCHNEDFSREFMKEIHLKFLEIHPYY